MFRTFITVVAAEAEAQWIVGSYAERKPANTLAICYRRDTSRASYTESVRGYVAALVALRLAK